MLKYFKKLFALILILTLTTTSSCNTKQEKIQINSEAMEYNNKAMEIYTNTMFEPTSNVVNQLYEALKLLDKATKISDEYYMAYINKSTILSKLKRYKDAIQVLDTAIALKENNAEAISTQGFLYEKIGEIRIAEKKYNSAILAYDNRLKENPKNMNDEISKIFIMVFTEGKDTSLKQIAILLEKDPNNSSLKQIEETIKYFSREDFINNI